MDLVTSPTAPTLGEEQLAALHDIEQGPAGRFIFVTGRAGTGKSTLLREFVSGSRLRCVVVAPTGLAAIQVGGQTIHSFFGFPLGPLTNDKELVHEYRRSHPKRKLMENLDCLVIDEVSMVRADVLDAIDFSLRQNTGNNNLPFGGKTIVAFGDIRQLEPVVTGGADQEMISDRFASAFFFDAEALRSTGIDVWNLETVYRQRDEEFLWALERVRLGDPYELSYFNERVGATLENPHTVTLTATNAKANSINQRRLAALAGTPKVFKGESTGAFDRDFPSDPLLMLKPGAQVMFVKNGKEWSNGTLGTVRSLHDGYVVVDAPGSGTVAVEPEKWEKSRYTWDSFSSRIGKEVVGEYSQLPLKLAWAVTIHKSQGLTLASALIDLDQRAFAHGQVYVALSRCRSIEGLSLARPIRPEDLVVNPRVAEFESRAKLS
ncbi:MAG: AAA family ATPase [Armatimonadetes bacterium]|nr:AAA family ATPase [Armatimonadota bacterium]